MDDLSFKLKEREKMHESYTSYQSSYSQKHRSDALSPSLVMMSPRNFSTPIKSTLGKIIEKSELSNCQSLKLAPRFTTPPSRIEDFVVTNPFDAELRNKLHLPIFSPSVFQKCVTPSKEYQDSYWNIDDLSRIYPAPIEEKFLDIEQVFSPETEQRTQQAIESYFCTTQVLQSPWLLIKRPSILTQFDDDDEQAEASQSRDPGINLDEASPDVDSANTSFRRKLFDRGADMSIGSVGNASPIQSGSSLLKSNVETRGFDSPNHSLHDRSPSISPITNISAVIKPHSFGTRLDFSNEGMSVDVSIQLNSSDSDESDLDVSCRSPMKNSNSNDLDTGYDTVHLVSIDTTSWMPSSNHITSSTPSKTSNPT